MALPVYSFFDPGSRRMGWAVGTGEDLPRVGAFTFKATGENLGHMMHQVAGAVIAHIDLYGPAEVAYEEPILVRTKFRRDNLATLRKTIPLGARIEEICFERGIPCWEESVQAVKTELAGLRTADKTEMVVAARKLGVTLPEGPGAEDAADALGGWLVFLRKRNRALSARFDQVLWSTRPGMLL